MSFVVLLGPQRFNPSVASVLDSLGIEGGVAVVTAGWREREQEVDELRDHVGRDLVNLRLYERSDEILAHDAPLAAALREHYEGLREIQELYLLRLAHALEATRELLAREGGEALRDAQRAAFRSLRALDRQQLATSIKHHARFEASYRCSSRPSVASHRAEIAHDLESTGVLAIAGGDVSILLHRLRLFDLLGLIGDRAIVAWSAGAMALGERVVLFHDSPPQGPGNAEVFDSGLGVCHGIIPLPHAKKRLRLDDRKRVELFARRFAPDACVVLDDAARMEWNGSGWRAAPTTQALSRRGRLIPVKRVGRT